jgi:hypothetical protein
LGVVLGYKRIPDEWKSGIAAIADQKFRYTDFSFKTIVDSNVKRAIALATKHGGRVEGDTLIIKTQAPKPAKLELWDDYGSPGERIASDDPRWSWKGNWSADQPQGRRPLRRKTSSEKGAEATISFEGTGAVIVGPYLPNGGKAQVWLDGKPHSSIDVYSDEDAQKRGESVWHAFGLKNGNHTVRLVVSGEPYPGSKGAEVAIEDLIAFRP